MQAIVFYFFSKKYYIIFLFLISILFLTENYFIIEKISDLVTSIFTGFLKLLSIPLVFLSIVVTIGKIDSFIATKKMLKNLVIYTFLTTIIASTMALFVFLIIRPSRGFLFLNHESIINNKLSYFEHIKNIVPTNFIQPFYENNVLGAFFLALLIGIGMLALPIKNKNSLNTIFSSLFKLILWLTQEIVKFIPLAMIAFLCLLIKDLGSNLSTKGIGLYLLSLLISNLSQAFIILPIFLLSKGISPFTVFKKMFPAILIAFFSKSSSVAMPTAIDCAIGKLKISKDIALFSFPLCTTINMNACAAFILITVLFVGESSGFSFNFFDLIMWVFIASIAAVGNAGVPMGCYFLTCSLLSTMNFPLSMMGLILPFYTLLDMVESAINLWSDSCVTAMVDKDIKKRNELGSLQSLRGKMKSLRKFSKGYNPIKT